MIFHLGTHEPTWIGRSPVPLFVSMTRVKKFPARPARAGWACDSGGFTQLHRGGWTTKPEDFIEQVYYLADKCPGMMWASPQDWMCEPSAVAATGLSVADHMRLTVENYCTLKTMDPRDLIVPVLQGWLPGDHERCVEMYEDAGVNLFDKPIVGVGSICRRQATDEIAGIIERLAALGLSLHGFGIKTLGLKLYGKHLASADSLAWSFQARMKARDGRPPLCGNPAATHASCQNCYDWAHLWRDSVLRSI